jgi:hypothetical protein
MCGERRSSCGRRCALPCSENHGSQPRKLKRVSEKIEDWKAITPNVLIAPVEHIRKSFDRVVWKCSEITDKLCFAELHPDGKHVDLDSYKSPFVTYRRLSDVRPQNNSTRIINSGPLRLFFTRT